MEKNAQSYLQGKYIIEKQYESKRNIFFDFKIIHVTNLSVIIIQYIHFIAIFTYWLMRFDLGILVKINRRQARRHLISVPNPEHILINELCSIAQNLESQHAL